MHRILILTHREDSHARAVFECLIKKGAKPIRWFTNEFLLNDKMTQRITQNGKHAISLRGKNSIDFIDFDVVWYRRPKPILLPKSVVSSDREFVETENLMHMRSLWLTIGGSARWINPFSSFERSNSKIFQLREASRLALNIPETLISNDKRSINDFICYNCSSGTIYKTFFPSRWEENNKIYSCYSTSITIDMLPNEDVISLTPGIYQKTIAKKYEIRVTFFEDEYIAVKIHNRQGRIGVLYFHLLL